MFDLKDIFKNEKLNPEHIKAFGEIGFYCWNNHLDYTDLEVEATTKEETATNERESLNLQVTFDWENSLLYAQLGCNLGDGFDSYLHIPLDTVSFDEKVKQCAQDAELAKDFSELLKHNQDAFNQLLQSAKQLSHLLYPNETATT